MLGAAFRSVLFLLSPLKSLSGALVPGDMHGKEMRNKAQKILRTEYLEAEEKPVECVCVCVVYIGV